MGAKRVMIENRNHIKDKELGEAVDILRSGGLAVFPMETIYGLGGNTLDGDAAGKIYVAKGRPSNNPLIAYISCMEEVAPLVEEIPEAGRKLMEAFRPGPLTMMLPKSDKVPYGITGSLDTVVIRMPGDSVANRLIALVGVSVTVPSANTSGHPSPTTADHVWQDMSGRIEMIIDGGPVGIGAESTIVDASSAVSAALRPGVITMEMLGAVLGDTSADPTILGPLSTGVRPEALGMKYKYYAPRIDLTLVEPEDADRESGLDKKQLQTMIGKVRELSRGKTEAGCKVGVTCTDESRYCYTDGVVHSIDERKSQASVAHNLHALPREFDDLGADHIFSESFPKDHLGQAVMNHLSETAGYKIAKV